MTARRPQSLDDVVAGDEVARWSPGGWRCNYEFRIVDRATKAMIVVGPYTFNRKGHERGAAPYRGQRIGPIDADVLAVVAEEEAERRSAKLAVEVEDLAKRLRKEKNVDRLEAMLAAGEEDKP